MGAEALRINTRLIKIIKRNKIKLVLESIIFRYSLLLRGSTLCLLHLIIPTHEIIRQEIKNAFTIKLSNNCVNARKVIPYISW